MRPTEGAKRTVYEAPYPFPPKAGTATDSGAEAAEKVVVPQTRVEGEELTITLLDVDDEVVENRREIGRRATEETGEPVGLLGESEPRTRESKGKLRARAISVTPG